MSSSVMQSEKIPFSYFFFFFLICVCICFIYVALFVIFYHHLLYLCLFLCPYLHNAHVYVLTNQFAALSYHESGHYSGCCEK